MSKHVVVVGGGLAGLSAASALVERRFDVTLVERRGILGGRTSSSRDAVTGDVVDCGTHVMIGAYVETLALLRRVGCEELVSLQDDLVLEWAEEGGRARLRCPPLVAPLHLLAGLVTTRLPLRVKVEAARFGLHALRGGPAPGETLAAWFGRTGQGGDVRRLLWDPLVLAILNETPERVAASLFHRVFREAFLTDHRASRLAFLTVGWSDLAERIERYVLARGGRVSRRCQAEGVALEPAGGWAVQVRRAAEGRHAVEQGAAPVQETLSADAVVLAVPWHAVGRLVPEALRGLEPFGELGRLGGSPIVSVELWLDRPVLDRPMLGFRSGDLDWVFDKGRIMGRIGAPQYLSLVASAAARLDSTSNASLVASAVASLRRYCPAMHDATVVRTLVLRNPQATFSATPEAEKVRPGARTGTPGLYLAGDWTATGLPATIEGAVRSGLAAARAVESDLPAAFPAGWPATSR